VAGTMAAIATSAMPIIQRIRKTMFGAKGIRRGDLHVAQDSG
jgi:hypothetical protein